AAYRYGVLPRHARLMRASWIFAPPTSTGATAVDGSNIKVTPVAVGPSWAAQVTEARNWSAQLQGSVLPVTDLAKRLKEALAKEAVSADVMAKGSQLLAIFYMNFSSLVKTGGSQSINDILRQRDSIMRLQAYNAAIQLKETNSAIKSFIDEQLKDIDANKNL